MEVVQGKRGKALAPSEAEPVGLDQSASAAQSAGAKAGMSDTGRVLSAFHEGPSLFTKACRPGLQVGVSGIGAAALGAEARGEAELHGLFVLSSRLVSRIRFTLATLPVPQSWANMHRPRRHVQFIPVDSVLLACCHLNRRYSPGLGPNLP